MLSLLFLILLVHSCCVVLSFRWFLWLMMELLWEADHQRTAWHLAWGCRKLWMSSHLTSCHTWRKRRRCFRYRASVGCFCDFGFFSIPSCLWVVVNNSQTILSLSTSISNKVKWVMLILITVRWEGGVEISRWQPCFNLKVLNFNGIGTKGKDMSLWLHC